LSQNATGQYANSAFVHANSAFIKTNSAFGHANAAFIWANSAYDKANTDKANLVNGSYTAQLYSNGVFGLPGNLLFQPSKGKITNDGAGILGITANSGNTGIVLDDAGQAVLYGKTGVLIQTNEGIFDSSPKDFLFGQDGVLTLPGSSGQIGRNGYFNGIDLYNNSGGTGYVRMNYADESFMWVDAGGSHIQSTGNTWNFNPDGTLTFPDNTVQNTSPVATSYYANSAFANANAAFAKANAGFIQANASFNHANAAFANANGAFAAANAAYIQANSGFFHANAAFANANGAFASANAAYNQANSAFIKANAAFATANVKTQTYVQATSPAGANVDDIWIDSSSGIQYVYINSNSSNQWVEFSAYSSPLNGTANIQFADQTIFTVNSAQDLVISNPSTANIKLISGNTVITGNLIANATGKEAQFNDIRAAYFRVNTATTVYNAAAVNIVGSTGYYTQQPTSNGYMIQITGNDNSTSRVVNDSAGVGSYSAFIGRHARGTHQNPTAAQAGDLLARFSGNGFGATGYGVNAGGASMDVYATENYTDVARGSKLVIATTANGTNARTVSATFDANTSTFAGTVAPQKGFVYPTRTANVGNSVAVTIDFANDAIVRCTVNADMTVYFTNYTVGKIVDLWVTNLSATNKTVTHGVSATNATNNGTTKVIPGTSTAKFQFYSIDGDLANTFVAITQG
jgi:hypothetical protein